MFISHSDCFALSEITFHYATEITRILHHLSIFVKVDRIMHYPRALVPLLLTLLLLFFAQQGGAMHALRHALAEHHEQQQDKHAPHSSACGHCAAYMQLGGVLCSAFHSFAIIAIPSGTIQFNTIPFRSNQPLIAVARGPPGLLQEIA